MTAGSDAVTIVIPTLNEAANIVGCIRSAEAFAHVVVVDSGSNDGTQALAREAGATVLDFHWQGGFPKKRNWTLRNHAFETDWVLFLDADERITPAFVAALTSAVAGTPHDGFWLRYRNHFMGRELRHGVPQRKLALLRIGAGEYERIDDPGWSRFDMEIHEHPILSGSTGEITTPLIHDDFRGLHHFIARHNDYSSWEARRYHALMDTRGRSELTGRQRTKYRLVTHWWFAPAYFLFTYVIRRGFLDGRVGLLYAVLKMIYFFEIRAKIREPGARGNASVQR